MPRLNIHPWKLSCCCSERQIPCLSVSGESGAVSVYNANHICTALPPGSSGEEPQSSFNCFSALTTTTTTVISYPPSTDDWHRANVCEQGDGEMCRKHAQGTICVSVAVTLYFYCCVFVLRWLMPSFPASFRSGLRASAKGSSGMTEMQGNRAVHIAFNRSMTSSLANQFYHLWIWGGRFFFFLFVFFRKKWFPNFVHLQYVGP